MKVDIAKLEEAVHKNGMKNEDFADCLGIDASTYYRKKQKCFESLTVGQMHKAVEVLELTSRQACDIFLS